MLGIDIKFILKLSAIIILIPIVAFLLLTVYLMANEYKPKEKTLLFENKQITTQIQTGKNYTVIIWNVGFAGLGDNMDFFYDGGTKVRDTQKRTSANFAAIQKQLLGLSPRVDFMLLQEVDKKSKRTYDLDEVSLLTSLFKDRNVQFGKNYDVKFVPLPILSPLGHVKSGLVTISKYIPNLSTRYSFPAKFAFPKKLAMLNRCFLVNRYKLENGKEFVLVNTHNSAYDDGSMRKQEMAYFKNFLLNEYKQGNYVLVGGDWNQTPSAFSHKFTEDFFDSQKLVRVPNDFLPEWNWIYDETTPSLRRIDEAYKQGRTRTTVVDFYLASPNLAEFSIKNINLAFANSDHNPVQLSFKLK